MRATTGIALSGQTKSDRQASATEELRNDCVAGLTLVFGTAVFRRYWPAFIGLRFRFYQKVGFFKVGHRAQPV